MNNDAKLKIILLPPLFSKRDVSRQRIPSAKDVAMSVHFFSRRRPYS